MKQLLLLICLLTSGFAASAQYTDLAIYGVAAGLGALKGHPQKPDEFVNQVSYQGRTFAQKRTPADKLPKKGAPQIMAVEQLLASNYAALQASATDPVLGSDGEANLNAVLAQLQVARPLWSITAYSEEIRFYRQEDSRRQYERSELERKQAYQRQVRERARRDSVERLALNRRALVDSTRRATLALVQAQADSAVRRAALLRPSATEQEFVQRSAVVSTTRIVPSARHVVTAHKPVVRKVVTKVKRSSGPSVYYCASGNTVKYHASPTCRGLSRCGASVVPISLSAAQQSMNPCKWCY